MRASEVSPPHEPFSQTTSQVELDLLPRCPTWCKSEPPSNPPGQPMQTWSPFHFVSPTSHSKFSNKCFCDGPSRRRRPDTPTASQSIPRMAPNRPGLPPMADG